MSSPDESSRWPDLIYVNGPSTSGKTTLCLDDFIFESAPRYYLGADTAHQADTDRFTGQGVEMITTSPLGSRSA